MAGKLFDEMTGLYSLSKTLRFELKPVGKTKEKMKEHEIIATDKHRSESYQKMKKILDKIHNRFIVESLSDVTLDWSDVHTYYQEYRSAMKNKKDLSDTQKKEFQKERDEMLLGKRKNIGELFLITAEKWKKEPNRFSNKGTPFLSDKGYKVLTEKGILDVLLYENQGDSETCNILNEFAGFFTYFTGYNQNRENYYSIEGKATEVAYRVVDQNLVTFCNNILLQDIFQESGFIFLEEEQVIFDINYYNACLTQSGVDSYNALIGRKYEEVRVKGINQRINEHNQKLSKSEKKLPKLKQLYKQIGSAKEGVMPFRIVQNNQELYDILQELLSESLEYNTHITNLVDDLVNKIVDFNKIRLSKSSFTYFSNKYFTSWHILQEKAGELGIFKKAKKGSEEEFIIPKYISLGQMKEILQSIDNTTSIFKSYLEFELKDILTLLRKENPNNRDFLLACIDQDFKGLLDRDEIVLDEKENSIRFVGYNSARKELESILGHIDKNNQEHKNIIKRFTDASIALLRFVKTFQVNDESLDQDDQFYPDLTKIIESYGVTKLYDAIRNYLTQKPFSEEKMKLNFENSTLGAGWDKNKEVDNSCVLLKDDNKFYLAVMKKDNNKFFRDGKELYQIEGKELLQKMEYKLLPGPNKMLPKCLMPGKDKQKYSASDEVLRLYEAGEFKKGNDFNKKSLETLIDFYKSGLKQYVDRQVFDFSFRPTGEYQDISQFYNEVEKQGYKLSRTNINKEYLREQADQGNVYLFEISSKDFDGKSKTKDLQTIYREQIFAPNSTIKLNGGAELFYRKGSIERKQKQIKVMKDHIIENKRYTEDKLLFHVPITLGFGSDGVTKFNQEFNKKLLKYKDDIKIIGIDRGEKHLAFYSVIDQQQNIIEQGTLNIVGKKGHEVDYEQKLSEKAGTRLQARQNWETIGNIKNLKDGYISHVVKKIADLMIEHNAVVVFEDLNGGFKRGRQKIEQSVYQKLELALAKKLSFSVNKGVEEGEPGSATNAYQLSPEIKTFGDIKGKQRGSILYTRANYTSTTDPVSGFRKNLYLKKGKLVDMKERIKQFDTINYDIEKDVFFFSYSPENFTEGRGKGMRTVWSHVDRYRGSKDRSSGKWNNEKVNITDNLKKLCSENNINLSQDILSQVVSMDNLPAKFYEVLIWNFDVILQVRNTGAKDNPLDSDFIHSPVEPFFDSREHKKNLSFDEEYKDYIERENSEKLPTSGDANGAYNIARKGLMMAKKIIESPEKPDLFISDNDWDHFVVNKKP